MGKSKLFHHTACRDIARAVKRCIHDRDLILHAVNRALIDYLCLDLCNIFVVDRCTDDLVESFCLCLLCSHRLNGGKIGDRHNFLSHALVMRRCKLCAVLPVNLVAVVLRRVVAGGDVDAGDAAKLADGKGKLRRRAQRLEPVRLDAICRQCQRCFLGKFRGHMTGVKCDRHAFCRAALLDDVICQSLGRTADGVDIHPVNTCTDDAAQSCRTKLQIHIETLFNLIFIALNGA